MANYFNTDYKVSECKKVINTKTRNIIKETIVGYTRGFWICKKFISKKKLNDFVEIIPGTKYHSKSLINIK